MSELSATVVDAFVYSGFAAYVLEVKSDVRTFRVAKRFRSIAALHAALTARGLSVPPLPAKVLTGRTSAAVMDDRKRELARFFAALMSTVGVARSFEVLEFFSKSDAPLPAGAAAGSGAAAGAAAGGSSSA